MVSTLIKIKINNEPQDFDSRVRQPGLAFLARTPRPNQRQWSSHDKWTLAAKDLYRAYHGICAYTGCHIPSVTGTPTVDHQRPKSRYPLLAYEWQNLRLAALLPNSIKRAKLVLDPRIIEDDWFYLDLPSLMVVPNRQKSTRIVENVKLTIEELKLNDDRYILMRKQYFAPFLHNMCEFDYLEVHAPFLARELKRQKLDDRHELVKVISLPRPPITL